MVMVLTAETYFYITYSGREYWYAFWKLDIGLYLKIIEEPATVNPLIIVLMRKHSNAV